MDEKRIHKDAEAYAHEISPDNLNDHPLALSFYNKNYWAIQKHFNISLGNWTEHRQIYPQSSLASHYQINYVVCANEEEINKRLTEEIRPTTVSWEPPKNSTDLSRTDCFLLEGSSAEAHNGNGVRFLYQICTGEEQKKHQDLIKKFNQNFDSLASKADKTLEENRLNPSQRLIEDFPDCARYDHFFNRPGAIDRSTITTTTDRIALGLEEPST